MIYRPRTPQVDKETQSVESSGTTLIPSLPVSTLSHEEERLKNSSAQAKDTAKSVNHNRLSDTGSDLDSMECEHDIEECSTAEVDNPQCSSIDENAISVYDISRAVQLKKTSDAEKLNYFNNYFTPAYNFKFLANNMGLANVVFNIPG